MTHYCDFAPDHPIHASYHNTEYGFPVADESVLFERLALEIMQAGLSWEIVLKKRAGLNKAFKKFDVDKVARFGDKDVARLLADEGIIRNRLKIAAIIHNAGVLQGLREEGGFSVWLAAHHPQSVDAWVKLFKKNFKFTGPEIVGEFLMSIGLLDGAHKKGCPILKKVKKSKEI